MAAWIKWPLKFNFFKLDNNHVFSIISCVYIKTKISLIIKLHNRIVGRLIELP